MVLMIKMVQDYKFVFYFLFLFSLLRYLLVALFCFPPTFTCETSFGSRFTCFTSCCLPACYVCGLPLLRAFSCFLWFLCFTASAVVRGVSGTRLSRGFMLLLLLQQYLELVVDVFCVLSWFYCFCSFTWCLWSTSFKCFLCFYVFMFLCFYYFCSFTCFSWFLFFTAFPVVPGVVCSPLSRGFMFFTTFAVVPGRGVSPVFRGFMFFAAFAL